MDAGHAVVLGAGIAGLAHAAVLAARFDQVTLVERDAETAGAQPRGGVPQGRHVHLLLPAGLRGIEALLPGTTAALLDRGGHLLPSPEWRMQLGGGRLDLRDPSLQVAGATRPLVEAVVRERVLALPGVEHWSGWAARSLRATQDGGRVTGVLLRSATDPDVVREVDADLVVDTTGRGSAAPRWLDELGHARPAQERLTIGVHYATRLFRRDPADLDGDRHVLVGIPPDGRRGGVAVAVEGGRWLVTLVGRLGERPPTDLPGFVGYAASLWVDDLHRVSFGSAPLDDGTRSAFPAYLRHRYDRLTRLPERFVVAGDAVCSLNPVLGQGMSLAILEAQLLGEVLDRHGLDRTGARVLRRARPLLDDAWSTAAGTDLAHPDVEGPRPASWRLVNAYLERLMPVAHRDPVAAEALVRVMALLDRPPRLLRPRIAGRVVRAAVRGTPPPPAPQPPAPRGTGEVTCLSTPEPTQERTPQRTREQVASTRRRSSGSSAG